MSDFRSRSRSLTSSLILCDLIGRESRTGNGELTRHRATAPPQSRCRGSRSGTATFALPELTLRHRHALSGLAPRHRHIRAVGAHICAVGAHAPAPPHSRCRGSRSGTATFALSGLAPQHRHGANNGVKITQLHLCGSQQTQLRAGTQDGGPPQSACPGRALKRSTRAWRSVAGLHPAPPSSQQQGAKAWALCAARSRRSCGRVRRAEARPRAPARAER